MDMDPRSKHSVKKFLKSWLINTLAVLVAVHIVPGITMDNRLWTPFAVALVLGILNAFIRPILMFLALPLLLVTLGLFMIVINALLLDFVSALLKGFQIDSFWWALLGALIISIVSTLLSILTGSSRARFQIRRGPIQRERPKDDEDGPIIDV